jgi:hypothetical protein
MLSYLASSKLAFQSLLILGLFPFFCTVTNAQWSVHLGLMNSQIVDPLVSYQSYEGNGLKGRLGYHWTRGTHTSTVGLKTGHSRLNNRQNNYWDSRSFGFFLHSELPATPFFSKLHIRSGLEAQLFEIESFFFMESNAYKGRKSGFGAIRIPLLISSNYFLNQALPITWTLNLPVLEYTLRPGYSVFDPEELFGKDPTFGNILKTGKWSPITSPRQWQWELKWSPQSQVIENNYVVFVSHKYQRIPFPQVFKGSTIQLGVGVYL